MSDKKEKKEKKGFFKEFKEFITRGNVLDMAVGVIVGGAFTAIVTALSNNILKPIINWILAAILGKDSLSEIYTFLVRGYDANGVLDLTQSIYIDWGAFINAIINFLLIALVLFVIVKVMAKVTAMRQEFRESLQEAAEKRRLEREQEEAAALEAQNAQAGAENDAAAPAQQAQQPESSKDGADKPQE